MNARTDTARCTWQQLPQAMLVLGRAFHQDPFSVFVFPDEDERQRRLPALFAIPAACLRPWLS